MHFSLAFYFDTLFPIKHKPDPGKYIDTSQTAIPIAVVILIWMEFHPHNQTVVQPLS